MDQKENLSGMVRLLDANGAQIGILTLKEAGIIASDRELEIVFLNENVEPAVVQIADSGRLKYTQSKNEKRARKKQHIVKIKELTMRYLIGNHDYLVKLSNTKTFLEQGFNVKFLVQLRGREIRHARLAIDLCHRFITDLAGLAVCQRGPTLEGRTVITVLGGHEITKK